MIAQKKQNSRPAATTEDWKRNKYDVYLPVAEPTPNKKKRGFEEETVAAISTKRSRKGSGPGQLLKQYGALLLGPEISVCP